MKYRLFITAFFSFLLITQQSHAQLKGFSFGPYIEAAWPHGDLAQGHTNGIGAGLGADVRIGGHLSVMGSYGILYFGTNNTEINTKSINARPLRLGLKYRLPFIYFKLESGQATFSKNYGSAAIVSPGIGVRVLGLDIQGSYETWLRSEGWSFASLKVAYHF